MGMVSRLLGHRPTSRTMSSDPAGEDTKPAKVRKASDRYLRELDEKLNENPQFLRDLEETPRAKGK